MQLIKYVCLFLQRHADFFGPGTGTIVVNGKYQHESLFYIAN